MPYLVDRPQNMNRHPNGIKGESFYQKDFNNEHPDYVTVQKVYSESTKKYVDYILCQNKETLLFLANLGCIEINPWNSKIDTLENPDYILFDLDPVEVDFDDVVKVAREINELCEELDIPSFCKTSGKRGLHIYLPLGARYDFEQIKIFAELIAVKIQNRLPKIVSLERSPDDRKGKVYIDYLQNRKGQTTACAYSVRPTEGATVSTPLKWDEVNGRLDPKRFNIKNMRERLDKVGDLWEGVLGEGIDIVKVLKKLS
jgi:bifunctional non-homologous end joining protein LigD